MTSKELLKLLEKHEQVCNARFDDQSTTEEEVECQTEEENQLCQTSWIF
jgi:hypothetical protein